MIESITQMKGYSEAIITPPNSRIAWLSGQLPIGDGKIVEGGFKPQLEQVFANLDTVLKNSGTTWDNVVRMTWYVCNLDTSQLAAVTEVRSRYINNEKSPATALVGVARLGHPDFLVEIDAVAVVPD